jgi:hypothetical protein
MAEIKDMLVTAESLKNAYDNLNTNKLDSSELSTAINTALAQAKESGEFDGAKGADGSDYILTDEDKAEIASLVPHMTTPMAPLFANGTAAMTDTSTMYVNTETGTLWRYQEATFTREVPVTEAIEATADNSYKDANRFNADFTDTYTTGATGYHITPLIDLTKPEYVGKTIQIHLEGATYASTGTYAQWIQCRTYGTDGTVIMPRPYTCDVSDGSVSNSIMLGTNDDIRVIYNSSTSATVEIDILPLYGSTKVPMGYIRFCGKGAVASSNIYITYANTETVTEMTWVDTDMTYAPNVTEEDKQQIADDVIARIDAELLSIIGSGEVV